MTRSLGERVAHLFGDTAARVRLATAGHEAQIKAAHTISMLETMERELAPTIQRMFGHVAETGDIHDAVMAMTSDMGEPTRQVDFIIQAAAIVMGAFGLAGAINAGIITDLTGNALDHHRAVPVPEGAAVNLLARHRGLDGQAVEALHRLGYADGAIATMVEASRHKPDVQTAILLRRRKLITDQDLVDSIADSGIDSDAVYPLTRLVTAPLPAGVAVSAAVQSHITLEQMADLVELDGVDRRWAQTWYDTAGRPPGVELMLNLFNRGLVDQGQIYAAIAESDVKNKYADAIFAARHVIPPERSIVAMLRHSVITEERARTLLAWRGYFPEDIDSMVREALANRAEQTRALAQGQVIALYEERALDRAAASDRLAALRYDTVEVGMLLDLADVRHEHRRSNAATGRVRAMFVGRHIDQTAASNALDRLGVGPEHRDDLLAVWGVERDIDIPRLTLAQTTKAFKDGIIDEPNLIARLRGYGYQAADIDILAQLVGATAPGGA